MFIPAWMLVLALVVWLFWSWSSRRDRQDRAAALAAHHDEKALDHFDVETRIEDIESRLSALEDQVEEAAEEAEIS